MMKLRINPIVMDDLNGIKKYIAEDNGDSAEKTVQEILQRFEVIQMFPYMGTELSK